MLKLICTISTIQRDYIWGNDELVLAEVDPNRNDRHRTAYEKIKKWIYNRNILMHSQASCRVTLEEISKLLPKHELKYLPEED